MTRAVEVSDSVAKAVEDATDAEVGAILRRVASEFIDVTTIGMPRGQKVLVYSLTGKTLIVRGVWTEG